MEYEPCRVQRLLFRCFRSQLASKFQSGLQIDGSCSAAFDECLYYRALLPAEVVAAPGESGEWGDECSAAVVADCWCGQWFGSC